MAKQGHVVGMTGAHEASACQEVGLRYSKRSLQWSDAMVAASLPFFIFLSGMVTFVDNLAHGVADKLTLGVFHEGQDANRLKVEAAVEALVMALSCAKFPLPMTAVGGDGPTPEAGTPLRHHSQEEKEEFDAPVSKWGGRTVVDLVINAR